MKERKDIKEQYKWRLNDMISDDGEWERGFATLAPETAELVKFKGSLADDGKLLEYLTAKSKLTLLLTRLYVWAHMNEDADTRDSKYQAMLDRVETEVVKYSAAFAFEMPELSAFSDEKLKALSLDPDFKEFSTYFDEVLRSKKLILSEKEEKIIAETGAFSDSPKTAFEMFNNADIRFEPVTDENGKKIEMSHGMYGILLQNPNQKIREAAFNSMFNAFKQNINTLAAIYSGNVKKDWFYAKMRGFESSLAYALYDEQVSPKVYEQLIFSVEKGTKALHKYIALRKKILGVETLNMYDLHVSIVKDQNIALPYEKAFDLVKTALKPLGSEYVGLLESAYKDGWIDVFETRGKRSGAYSWGVFGTHPYVLLNYQKTVHDVFTIAHELGHSIHTYYSNLNQPFEKSEYVIFVAEIASTVNEVLMLKHLLKSATGDMRKYLLSYYLDMFRTTLFRQAMFAEFEAIAHNMAEKGAPLTAQSLNAKYLELDKKYYGNAVKHNDLIACEWSRIPHFYKGFYVYKYATGLTAAISIAKRILTEGETAVADYKKFLSAGSSMPPLDIIRLAGIDMETEKPFEVAMNEFAQTVKELEKEFGL